MKNRLGDSARELLKVNEKYVIKDTPLLLIALE
jgi:hypothetical protein